MAQRIDLPNATRDAILRESAYRCAVPGCGTTLALDTHHIVEVRKGGGNDPMNLVALCGTHHDLYHRGVISQHSIIEWKARLIEINRIDIRVQVEDAVNRALAETHSADKPQMREGFALAVSEFCYRTCEAGFVYDERFFVTTGFCCFVAQRLAVTTKEVVQYATEVAAARGGRKVVRTQRGLAPFEVEEQLDIGSLITIRMGEIDDRHVTELLKEQKPEVARLFVEPLQTPVRLRIAPFCGERVGFLHASSNSKDFRMTAEFQFDSADVSFPLTLRSKKEDFLQYVLTPVLSHIEHRGAPVFNRDGRLVGIMRETIRLEGELCWRPVIAAPLDLYKFSDEALTRNDQRK